MPINMITKETKEIYDNVCVDIDANDDGFYSLISTIEVHYSHDEISSLYLNDPTLLSFSLPSDYGGGVWILEQEEGEKILQNLTIVKEKLKNQGNEELIINIEKIIMEFTNNGPITGSST